MSDPFCDDCDRVRLTADGKLLSCLFDTEYHDLRHIVRNGGTDEELADSILKAVWKKPEGVGHMPWIKDGWAKPRNMNAIGG
jgi:cyclic pyranopterin phosphate synthase